MSVELQALYLLLIILLYVCMTEVDGKAGVKHLTNSGWTLVALKVLVVNGCVWLVDPDRGVNPAGDGGTRTPKMSNGGTVIRHAPPNMVQILL